MSTEAIIEALDTEIARLQEVKAPEESGTSLRLITSSVSCRTIQRARPSGGGEQTTAIMRCCCC
jgi:hypothetical protein